MGQVNPQNIDLSNPDWIWTMTPNPKKPNPIGQDAPTQSTVNSAPIRTPFNSKSLSDLPPTSTVTATPVILPQAENAKRSVSVTGAFGTVKNPA